MVTDELPLKVPISGFRVVERTGESDVTLRLSRAAEEAALSFAIRNTTVIEQSSGREIDLTQLVGAEVVEARCSAHVLVVSFDRDVTLRVDPALDYEAWEVVTPAGLFVGSPS